MRQTQNPWLTRDDFVRPIVVATALTFSGEMLILVFWGMWPFPEGSLLSKFIWTATCGIAMGATIGALTILFVTGRLRGRTAALVAAGSSFGVLSFCTILCYRLDLVLGLFGARPAPFLFVAGGLIPALFASGLYGWILHSQTGSSLLARIRWSR